MPDFDAIVVGLGAMGSAAAYHLARRGRRVLGIEAFGAGHQLGSSHGETRIIRLAYYEHPDYVPLLWRAYELWAELEQAAKVSLLTLSGGLMIGKPDSAVVAGALASAQQHGLEHALLPSAEVRQRYPALCLAEDDVALWEPRAGYLRPEQCIDAHLRLAVDAGAEVRYEEPVRGWDASASGVEVRTSVGGYTAEHLVFTCGARMTSVLGNAIPPIRAERIPLFWLQPNAPELFAPDQLPIYLWEVEPGAHVYGFPHVEWPGVKVARHHSGDYCDPDHVDRTVNAEDERRLRSAIAERLPSLNGPVVSSLVCLYENSPDEHFLIDRLAENPNVVYAGGFSGHGFKFSSVVGEIVADLVTRGEATPHAAFLRADRLAHRA
ncbi:MAG: N-methyl-L-tryptophan oxidase [Chloroflexi bacterium]|nr:N-methyl-L-tryptophan oxidase [Chloroflexota bacterium]MBV9601102.1 N-methyl-L-tryptophan oxidase [Chloroflexota bacterium]